MTIDMLQDKIRGRSAVAAVIGLGYVGLPMAAAIARAGYRVRGVDIDAGKVATLRSGHSYCLDVSDGALASVLAADDGQSPGSEGGFWPGTDFAALAEADIAILCVPTPLDGRHRPDISFIRSALDGAIPHLRRGCLVVLESTTYPGTTDELIRTAIERARGWKAGEDYCLCYSPERVDPGSLHYSVTNTPKIVGGVTARCLEAGTAFYASFLDRVVPVSSPAVAETAKLFENTFRSVNIGLVNELAPVCERLGISVWEVLDAAATKPFGFLPFYPGPGIGGHCIPVDPLYLSWKSKSLGLPVAFIELADRINRGQPRRLVRRIQELLKERGLKLRGAHILLSGIAYKKDIDDVRESPALDLFRLLRRKGAAVSYADPYVASFRLGKKTVASLKGGPAVWADADLVVITTDHSGVDYQAMADHAPLILDTRNATRGCRGGRIVLLGGGRAGGEENHAQ
ncbi:nucleotide sugar dehydrogenase [Paenibacillus spiritus]|uniref:Nucleotide sugar dehydrogenase n=1 Tax=Paenibacillus spiritus TaxID=2496557 RepID=A0A5J5FVR0_9BACL|nr:nucleotide sugar dehydrogenase [Paenibacillus spiritus]KAA8997919.1 nucleotide sugar dehydrogenase [Paenibacillus spiritus]